MRENYGGVDQGKSSRDSGETVARGASIQCEEELLTLFSIVKSIVGHKDKSKDNERLHSPFCKKQPWASFPCGADGEVIC